MQGNHLALTLDLLGCLGAALLYCLKIHLWEFENQRHYLQMNPHQKAHNVIWEERWICGLSTNISQVDAQCLGPGSLGVGQSPCLRAWGCLDGDKEKPWRELRLA